MQLSLLFISTNEDLGIFNLNEKQTTCTLFMYGFKRLILMYHLFIRASSGHFDTLVCPIRSPDFKLQIGALLLQYACSQICVFLQVKNFTFYDVVLDFILMDAFDDLENPPSSVIAVVNNRWLSNGFKETVS